MSRRAVLAAGAAATAVAATGLPALSASASDPSPSPDDPRGSTANVGSHLRADVVSAPALGEQVLYVAAGSLNPNGTLAGATSVFAGPRGAYPANAAVGSTNYLSTSVDVPIGSTLTNIEFVIEGSPQAGRVSFIRWTTDDTTTPFVYLYNAVLPAATGITVYSQPLAEVTDGTKTYEAFYTSSVTTSFCNGIRVRYLPPTVGLVPITPARAYDSRLNMAPDSNGPLSGGASRTLSIASSRNVDTGAVIGEVVPAGASAIAYTLTVADTTAAGFLAVNPGGVSGVSASTINWSANGQLLANTGAVKISPTRTVTVVAGGTGSTNFIIDIVGYYL